MKSLLLQLSTQRLCQLSGGVTSLLTLMAAQPISVSAQTVFFQETFKDSATIAPFVSGGVGAVRPCLTATPPLTGETTLPSCLSGNLDANGSGALRLTTNDPNRARICHL